MNSEWRYGNVANVSGSRSIKILILSVFGFAQLIYFRLDVSVLRVSGFASRGTELLIFVGHRVLRTLHRVTKSKWRIGLGVSTRWFGTDLLQGLQAPLIHLIIREIHILLTNGVLGAAVHEFTLEDESSLIVRHVSSHGQGSPRLYVYVVLLQMAR